MADTSSKNQDNSYEEDRNEEQEFDQLFRCLRYFLLFKRKRE